MGNRRSGYHRQTRSRAVKRKRLLLVTGFCTVFLGCTFIASHTMLKTVSPAANPQTEVNSPQGSDTVEIEISQNQQGAAIVNPQDRGNVDALLLHKNENKKVADSKYGIAGPGWTSYNGKELSERMASLNDLGVTWLRVDLLWDDIQPKNEKTFDWSDSDRLVNSANKYGIRLVFIPDHPPKWAAVTTCIATHWCQPRDSNLYSNFVGAAAKRYSQKGVHHWEIWNEQNTQVFWKPAPDARAYTELLRGAYASIKRADPESVVITGGLTGPNANRPDMSVTGFMQAVYDNGGGAFFDAVGSHPYTYPLFANNTRERTGWQQMISPVKSLRTVMVANGDSAKKIWITEYGAPTNGPGDLAQSGITYTLANSPDHVSEALQSELLADVLGEYKKLDFVGPFFWFTLQDYGTNPNNKENFFGLIRMDGSRKPAYDAYKNIISQDN